MDTRDHQAWEHRKNIPSQVRADVLARDNEQCQLCGDAGDNKLQLHHWKSFRSHGGAHTLENLVTLCWKCHEDVHAGRQTVAVVFDSSGHLAAFPGVRRK